MDLLRYLIVATFLLGGIAEAKEPPTHEALWLMKRVGTPVVSPDGKWVVFSVTEPAYDEKDQTSDLWLAPADGSAKPRKITFTKATEDGATWAADSKRIAFSSKREGDEQAQIYVLDIAQGGEAQRITNLSTGAKSPQFSPNGAAVAFVTTVFRGAQDDDANKKMAKEAKEKKTNVRVYESFPIRSWDRWVEPDKQLHVMVQALEPAAKARDLLAGTRLAAEPGFGGTGFGGDGGEKIELAWSKDSQSLVFAATTERNRSAYAETGADLYRVAASGGEPVRLAHATGSYDSPKFSADGKTLYAKFNANNGLPYNNDRIVAFEWPAAAHERTVVGPPFDRSVDSYSITPDGKRVYFTAEDSGLVKVYSASTTAGDAKPALTQESGVYDALQIADQSSSLVIVGRWGSAVNPAEIVRIEPGKKTHRPLSDFNVKQTANLDWQGPQHFWFKNAAGLAIHNMIVLPPGFDPNKKYPLFVLMHGGAANMWRDQISLRWNYHLLAKPGYIMVMTNYRGSSGFGEQLGRAIQRDPLRGPADDINAGADEAIKRFPFIDASRQIAGGASYGGHLANWMEATTTRYKAIVSHAGLTNLQSQWGTSDAIYHRELVIGGPPWAGDPLWREQSPIAYATQFKTPILLSVGERDFRVPMNNTLEMYAALQRMQVPAKLLIWPEENHWIVKGEDSRYFYSAVEEWLQRWIDK